MRNISKVIIFILIFFAILYYVGRILNPAGTLNMWYQSKSVNEFYRQSKNTIDVIYIGNSEIYSSISPMEIYDKTGITGFDFSSPGQKVWSSYYYIKEALKTQSPKIIFLSVGGFLLNKDAEDEQSKRKAIDPLNLSENKIEMVQDSNYKFSNYDKLGCIFPAIRYHSRWSSINEEDFRKLIKNKEETYKGFFLTREKNSYNGKKPKIKHSHASKKEEDKAINEIPVEVKEKLKKIMEVCQKNDCKLILFKSPEPTTWNEERHNIVSSFADENGLEFLDFNQEGMVDIDWKNDTYDGGNHLNKYGAEKVSKALSNYLQNNYKFSDKRKDTNYKAWNELLQKYNNEKISNKDK